jgi:hypothetical protein
MNKNQQKKETLIPPNLPPPSKLAWEENMQANGKKTQTKIQSTPKKHFLLLSPQCIRKCHHPYNTYTHNRWIAHITHTHTPSPKFKQKRTTNECTTENRHSTKEKKTQQHTQT